MIATLFLVGALIGAWRTWNALRPPDSGRIGPLWLPALLTGELALHQIAWQMGATAIFIWLGALDSVVGWIALYVSLASWLAMAFIFVQGGRAWPAVEAALRESIGSAPPKPSTPLRSLVRARPRLPAGVTVERAIPYGGHERQRLDLYVPEQPNGRVLLQIHGGSWMRGRRERHARPLMYRMAGDGWLVASMSYRVSPEATFPDHLVDVKAAIAWLRANASSHGAEPEFIAVTGGSAGAHLAAMAALTPNRTEFQPGFEEVDTTVQACAPFYGIFRLTNAAGDRGKWPFIDKYVMKSSPLTHPDDWRLASPLSWVSPEAPPFFVLHGGHDSLVSTSESTALVEALREASRQPVAYAELPWATHGFDYFSSRRSSASAAGVAYFLDHAYRRHHARRS